MALGTAVLALAAVSSWPISRPRSALYVAGWTLAAALVVLSESATGAILFMVLHGALATMLIWERLRHRVTRTHYGLIAAGGVGMAAMVWTRLDTLLGLLNRNSTLTGRVGLWRFIWDAVVTRRPLLGYGLGTLWTEPSFQIAVRDAVGWRFPVVIGDNGYLDSTMQLGILGTICLILALAWAAVHSARLFMRDPRTATAAPVIALLFLLVANITLSYFLETESFIWIVTWAMVFAAARASAQFEPRRLPRRSG
jgi:exopolysaccharide production protein ExoQ